MSALCHSRLGLKGPRIRREPERHNDVKNFLCQQLRLKKMQFINVRTNQKITIAHQYLNQQLILGKQAERESLDSESS